MLLQLKWITLYFPSLETLNAAIMVHNGSQDCSNCIGIPSNIFLCHSRRMVRPGRIHEWFQFVGASLRNESDWKALSEALFLPE